MCGCFLLFTQYDVTLKTSLFSFCSIYKFSTESRNKKENNICRLMISSMYIYISY